MTEQLLVILPCNVMSEDYDIIKDIVKQDPRFHDHAIVSPQFGTIASAIRMIHEMLTYRYIGYFFLYVGYFFLRLLRGRPIRFSLRWFRGEYVSKKQAAMDAFFDDLRSRSSMGLILPFADGKYGFYIHRNARLLLALGKPVYKLHERRKGMWEIASVTNMPDDLALTHAETRDRYIDMYGRPRVTRLFPGKPEDHFI